MSDVPLGASLLWAITAAKDARERLAQYAESRKRAGGAFLEYPVGRQIGYDSELEALLSYIERLEQENRELRGAA